MLRIGFSYSHLLAGRLTALLLGATLASPMTARATAAGSASVQSRESVPKVVKGDTPARKKRTAPARRAKVARARTVVAPVARWTSPRSAPALASDLATMLTSRVRGGQWGAMVISLTRGDTLFKQNPDAAMQPASNMKLFTTALALDQFGPAYQFSTDVLRDGALSADGTLDGNLILRGDGDPALSHRFLEGGPGAPMHLLAQLVAGAGVKRIRGNLIADASAFDPQRIPEGWQTRYLGLGYAARVSALSLNENLVWVVVHPGTSSKEPANVALDPAADFPITSSVRTVAGSKGAKVLALARKDGSIDVRGWIGSGAGERRYQLVVEDPAALAAGTFRRALADRGITIAGPTRFAAAPTSAVKVASLPSPPLARMLAVMNRESVNHYAELLFRDAGRTTAKTQLGSVESASRLLQQFMTTKVGAAPSSVYAADGSGLSVLDHVTPRALAQLLSYSHRATWSDAFHASLPVAGESELLRHRMRGTPAQGNLHAKTGTTNTVISLGGYVTAQDGELLAFAFIYNGADRWNAKTTIDQMGATLASFVRE